MLLVGTPRVREFADLINDREVEGIIFHVEKVQGLSVIVPSNADDSEAKTVIKQLIKNTPILARGFSSVQTCDKEGRIR